MKWQFSERQIQMGFKQRKWFSDFSLIVKEMKTHTTELLFLTYHIPKSFKKRGW